MRASILPRQGVYSGPAMTPHGWYLRCADPLIDGLYLADSYQGAREALAEINKRRAALGVDALELPRPAIVG